MKSRRAKVVYSYAPQNEDELKLEVDELIEVLDEVEEGWWRGRIRGAVGVFPSNFVVELSTSDSPQTNKTDLSSSDDNISGDNVVNDGNKQTIAKEESVDTEKKPKPIKGVGFGDIFASGKPKLSPVDNSPIDRNKVSVPKKPPPPTPASDTDSAPKLPPKPIREQAKVLFSYEAQNDDELTIKEGDVINIITKEIEDHGWWKGELSGRIGVFPDNFVELIKSLPEELAVPSRVKKPERPTEKPPPIAANQFKITPSKPDITKSSNKSIDELPKSSVVLNAGSSNAAPLIHGKKPTTHPQKPKSDVLPPNSTSSIKPDVVPQENGNKLDKDNESSKITPQTNNASTVITNTSVNDSNQFNAMDTSGNKLTHLTAQRPKGPSSRRPPSTIFIPKESPNDSKENGDISIIKSDKSDVNLSNSTSAEQIKPTQLEKSEKLPPWMLELRKAQEKRKETPDESPKEITKAPLSSPTKTSPNRFSGDFGNKINHQTSSVDDSSDASTPIHLLKPLKLTKPTVNITSSTGSVSNTSITTASNQSSIAASSVVFSTNLTSKTSNVVVNATNISPTNTTTNTAAIKTTKEEDPVVAEKKELSDLQKEIGAIKDSMVPRKDFDELVKQVSELKELVETNKQSYSKVIKDLINEMAEERKKLATLQIEIDRLRKLTTTV